MQVFSVRPDFNYKNVSFTQNKEDYKYSSFAQTRFEEYSYGSGMPCTHDYVEGYLDRGLKLISKFASDNVSSKINEKINFLRLNKLFSSCDISKVDLAHNKELIKNLAKLDFENVSEKYLYCYDNFGKYDIRGRDPKYLTDILEFEELTPKGLQSLHKMALQLYERDKKWNPETKILRYIKLNAYGFKKYNEFDIIPTAKQTSFINSFIYYIDDDYINNMDDNDELMNVGLIRDIKRCGSTKKMQEELTERMKNKPITPIEIDSVKADDFVKNDIFSFDNLYSTIGNMNLKKYKKGLPLVYPRTNFITDFKKELENLSPQEQKQVYDYYKFNIDAQNDIIKYPIPNNDDISDYSKDVKSAIEQTRRIVNDFMLNNSFVLDEDDACSEYLLNKFIEVFPEFISVTGKMEHRGDSIDFHTLEDLKLCLNSPQIHSLSEEEQRILFLSVMFHDISKKENMVDKGHQKPSALYAKEIIKKLPISLDEKERIYNLILNSHWTTEGKSAKDLGAIFRHGNDFKMAQILAEADTYSAGFDYAPDMKKLRDTENNIKKIKTSGIPLLADNLPVDKSKFPKTDDGIMYLDFTDKDLDLTEFGFRNGTKVKNLNMLCHSSGGTLESLLHICDDSKEICLSSGLLNGAGSLMTLYNNGCHVILHACNSDIALGGVHVGSTGGKRGFEEFKDFIYPQSISKNIDEYDRNRIEKYRNEIPNCIKEELDLTDEEYYDFYNQIEAVKSKNDIKRITLNSGRILHSYDIKKAINRIQSNLVSGRAGRDYRNEVVIFQPKIEAVVMTKQEYFDNDIKNHNIKNTAKENNIPIIIV